MAGPDFDTSLTEGQISLPAGVRCTLGTQTIRKSDVGRTARITGDLDSAATALLERSVLRAAEPVDPATVLAAERAIVRERFGGSVGRYRSALAGAHVTLADARAIIADRISRERIEQRFRPRSSPAADVSSFLTTYASTSVRRVAVSPRAPWLGDVDSGLALATLAPPEVFRLPTRRRAAIDTIDGRFQVQPLGAALPLFALPPAQAVSVAQAVLGRFARDAVFGSWLATQEKTLLQNAVCIRDDVPDSGDVDLTAWVPFLGE
jgi:hypothetical protein